MPPNKAKTVWRDAREAAEIGDWLKAATVIYRGRGHLTIDDRAAMSMLKHPEALPSAELRRIVDAMLAADKTAAPKAFIVHGWDAELKWEVKNYLQGTLGIECVVLHEQDGGGGTLIDKFERYAKPAGLAFILLSAADDPERAAFESPDAVKRPRPNVLFEMGYFFSRLGREGVVILRKGDVEIHSDVLGVEYIDVSNGVESAGERIRRRVDSWLAALR